MSSELILSYVKGLDHTMIRVGVITAVSVSLTKQVLTTPIVSKGVDSTFPLESGGGLRYTFSFSRVMPASPNDDSEDSTQWSNAQWYVKLTEMMDRWQAKTDGFLLNFNEFGENPHQCIIMNERGYIRSIERTYNAGDNTTIHGSLDVSIGTMYTTRDSLDLVGEYIPPLPYTYALFHPGTVATLPCFGERTVKDVLALGDTPIPSEKVQLPLHALLEATKEEVSPDNMTFVLPNLPPYWDMCRRLTMFEADGSPSATPASFMGWASTPTGSDVSPPGAVITLTVENIRSAPLELYAIWG